MYSTECYRQNSLKRPATKPPVPVTKRKQAKPTPGPSTHMQSYSNLDFAVLSSSKADLLSFLSAVQNLRTNAREYRCNFCDYMSKDQRNAKRHVELKHVNSGVVFKCKTCGKTATLKANLKAHYIRHHGLTAAEAASCML